MKYFKGISGEHISKGLDPMAEVQFTHTHHTHCSASTTPSSMFYSRYLDVLWHVLSLHPEDVCQRVGFGFEPEGDEPADEDDSCVQEALFSAVQSLVSVRVPFHNHITRLRPHRGNVCK